MASLPDPYSFNDYLFYSRDELRKQLATVIAALCTAIERAAFLRATEGRGTETYEAEGKRDALVEEKWLILRLMDTVDE